MKQSPALPDSCEHASLHPLGKHSGVGLLENVEIPPATARVVKFHFPASPAVGSFSGPASTNAGSVDVLNGMCVVWWLTACSFMLLMVW